MGRIYPEIEILAGAIRHHGLRLSVEPTETHATSVRYRRVVFQAGEFSWRVPVDDEDEDIEIANPVWLLDRVLRECHWYESSEDYLVWAKDLGLKAELSEVREIYFDLREISPQIRDLLGPDIHCISEFDTSFGTSVMQALRSYVLPED